MPKKLKISTPQTVDGKNLAYDSKKQPIYTHSIVELSAKSDFQKLNAKLPEHLRHLINEVEVDELGNEAVPKQDKKPKEEDK